MFSFSSGISSGSNTIYYRFFFPVIELLWDHWQISTDHICTDFLLDSLFCSVNHLICLSFHQGHSVLIIVASFIVVQLLSHVYSLPHHELHHARLPCLSLFPEWNSLKLTFSNLLKLTFIESVMPSNHLILCHTLLLLPSFFPSIRVFSNKSALCIRWPWYWSFIASLKVR